jgi:hypothetical protein
MSHRVEMSTAKATLCDYLTLQPCEASVRPMGGCQHPQPLAESWRPGTKPVPKSSPGLLNDCGPTFPSAFLRRSSRLERVTGNPHTFPIPWKHKARVFPVERRVRPVYCTVVIRADEHQIVQLVVAATAQPVHVVHFTEFPSVH